MKYLSFDIEATGLDQDCLMIEFAAIPFCTKSNDINDNLSFHHFIKCPSFEDLKPNLNPWVIENNQTLIEKAHKGGLELNVFKEKFEAYLNSKEIKSFFESEKICLFGKSVNAIDLPFLNRDLGWDFMRQYFSHRAHDLSAVAYAMIDMGLIPNECESGSFLMKHLGMGEVAHTALEDSINTAKMYLKLIKKVNALAD